METWAEEVNQQVQRHSLWNGRLCYMGKGGGGTSIKKVDPYADTNYRDMYNQFTEWLQPQMGGVTAYPGQMVPGQSPLQQQGFDVAQGLTPIAGGGQQYFGDMLGGADPSAPGRAMGMAETGIQNMMQPFDPSTIMQGLQPGRELAMDTFGDISKVLKERSVAGAGTADTGGLDRAMSREAGRLSLGLGAQAMPYLAQGQQNQLGRQSQAIGQSQTQAGLPGQVLGQAGQVGGQGMNMLSQILNMGGMQRGIAGEQMQEPYQKWQTEQPYNNPWINVLGSLQGSAPQMDYVSEQESPGFMSQMMPGLGMALGMPGGIGALGGNLAGLAGGAQGLIGGFGGAGGLGASGLLGGLGGLAALI